MFVDWVWLVVSCSFVRIAWSGSLVFSVMWGLGDVR